MEALADAILDGGTGAGAVAVRLLLVVVLLPVVLLPVVLLPDDANNWENFDFK